MNNKTKVKEKLKSKDGLSKKETELYSLMKYIDYMQDKYGTYEDVDYDELFDVVQKELYAIDRIRSCDSSYLEMIPEGERIALESIVEFRNDNRLQGNTEIELIKIEVDTFVEMTSLMFDVAHLIYMLEFEMNSTKFDIEQFNKWMFDMELDMGRVVELRNMLNIERKEDEDFDRVTKSVLKKAKDYMNNKRYLDD